MTGLITRLPRTGGGGEREGRGGGSNWQDIFNGALDGGNQPPDMGGDEPPPPPPREPRFTGIFRPWWRPISYAVAIGAGAFLMSCYQRVQSPSVVEVPVQPTRSPIELTVTSNGEPTFTTPELVRAASRVADMEQFLKNTLIYPDVSINTSGVGALKEEEVNKLLINANVGERVANWEFNDPGNVYNLNVEHTYENDGRLSRKFLRVHLTNRNAEPTRLYLDSSGLIRSEYLDSVRRSVLREARVISFGPSTIPYTNPPGVIAPARRGLAIDTTTGALIEIGNDNRGLVRMWETETFYTSTVPQ